MAGSTAATSVSQDTRDWLLSEENPAVAVLARQRLFDESPSAEVQSLWERRNEYAPVAAILAAIRPDGSWAPPARDYQKYGGSLWQVHFLGELHASGDDERVQAAARYAFGRQLADGSWSASNAQASGSIPCLTANVGRALARLGFARNERVLAALKHVVGLHRELGVIDCRWGGEYQLNGYCHMLAPKELLFLAEVPSDVWPDGARDLRDACVAALRDKRVYFCLPEESREFQDIIWSLPSKERSGVRDRFLDSHQPLHYKEKPGWLRFGYPLSYNSDALEAVVALAAVGEPMRDEYHDAVELVRASAGPDMRWTLKNTFNGKMLADIEAKGAPSRWLTLHALSVLRHFDAGRVS